MVRFQLLPVGLRDHLPVVEVQPGCLVRTQPVGLSQNRVDAHQAADEAVLILADVGL